MIDLKSQFLAFCRSKPADEEYDFFSTSEDECGCPAIQFVHSLGHRSVDNDDGWPIFRELHGSPFYRALNAQPMTFGALADRLQGADRLEQES